MLFHFIIVVKYTEIMLNEEDGIQQLPAGLQLHPGSCKFFYNEEFFLCFIEAAVVSVFTIFVKINNKPALDFVIGIDV